MIGRIEIERLRPEQKADLIYTQARNDLSSRLWRAALGDGGTPEASGELAPSGGGPNLESLLAVLTQQPAAAPRQPVATASPGLGRLEGLTLPNTEPTAAPATEAEPQEVGRAGGLGPNAQHQGSLERAAARTGIPTAALAAIVDAEAAKGRDGSWKLYSRNPRSSAAGLGQFLAGTWVGEAQRSGTWLNQVAKNRGWLNESGRVEKGAQAELLALRYDGETSIHAIADYAKGNLDRLRKAGVDIGGGVAKVAQAAYLGHHLGAGDAVKFLKGGLDNGRAATLLRAQVGAASANARLAQAGNATTAHRQWLLGFVERHIRPERFQA
ncbi:peptidoglycan-binding protein [Sphingosinicella sp. BN140058]|uniref:peptidoglycan-binding protein n=1 Tax=Sphingosinicella sp. BN140058 TaxID=1892855 RepID=UPI00101031CB|nr:peptidoglycan-binding protein [Sphingosinicella sp. BN140058]QAY77284.1 peptidoglycan-binding protein [Sphingosinicella sp. BN140058]